MLYYEILKHTEKEELELKQEYTANDDMTCEGAEATLEFQPKNFQT